MAITAIKQTIAIVQRLMQLRGRGARYLLVHRYEPQEMISENTLNTAISRMGYKGRLTGHGIRATISTALNEVGFVEEWIEAQLSHAEVGVVNVNRGLQEPGEESAQPFASRGKLRNVLVRGA
ncbi:tyrosine-type recombinase/integrase [Pseudomonas germanica]